MSIRIIKLAIFFIISAPGLMGQEVPVDLDYKTLIDSLDIRIKNLDSEIPRLSAIRDANYFYKKRDLDITIFLSSYYRFLSDEDIDQAKELIESRLYVAQKRKDAYSIDFFQGYKLQLTKEIGRQRARYQYLFKDEKNFKKVFYNTLNESDENSLKRCKHLTDLALKYAREQNLETVIKYLTKYEGIIDAAIYNSTAEYDLKKLTKSESAFQKMFTPLIESDSLELIYKADSIVEHCYKYSASTSCRLDTNFFAKKKKIVIIAISDFNARKGANAELTILAGQTIIARFDTINREGIYKWHESIIVIGHFNPKSKSENVNKGEAIIDADRRLFEYIRINRIAKLGKSVKLGNTFIIPFEFENKPIGFMFNPRVKKYQYMICYTRIKNKNLTQKITKVLPPLEFEVKEKLQ
jgi:hypothetical protein